MGIMICKKIRNILTPIEIRQLIDVLHIECAKPANHRSIVNGYINSIENTTSLYYYYEILRLINMRRSKIDNKIRRKIKDEIPNATFDLVKFNKKTKQVYYKYKKNDWIQFVEKAEYFFGLYHGPFDFVSFFDRNYLNRVYLGLGFEFLLKGIFLKKGYLINKFDYDQNRKDQLRNPKTPIRLGTFKRRYIQTDTHTLGNFIDILPKIKPQRVEKKYFEYYVIAGLQIARNWRNQDVHIPTGNRFTDSVIERQITYSYRYLYKWFLPNRRMPRFPRG